MTARIDRFPLVSKRFICEPKDARCLSGLDIILRDRPGSPGRPLLMRQHVKAITSAGDPRRAAQMEWISMDWRHEAACRDEDPELFFPIGNTGPALVQIEEAKAVCRRCSVVDECLRWALETGQDAGVWGGLSEDERRALKRRNARLRARSNV